MQIELESLSRNGAKYPVLKITAQQAGKEEIVRLFAGLSPDDVDSKILSPKNISVFTHPTKDLVESHKYGESGLLVCDNGEFEKEGVFITTQSNNAKSEGVLDVIEVEAEGIRVLYYAAGNELEKGTFEQLGDAHILILDVQPDFGNQQKSLQYIDPQVLMPVSADEGALVRFYNTIGITFEDTGKFKAKSQEFQAEEYTVRGVKLT